VTSIDEETGQIIVEDIFRYTSAGGGRQVYTGYMPSFLPGMLEKGLIDLEALFA
jgi:hypothetical protein